MADYNLNISIFWVVWPILLQGVGLGMIFVPLATIAYSTLPVNQSAEAAGMFNLLRTVGSSIGISIVTTLFTEESQVNWNVLGGHMNPSNPAFQRYLAAIGLPKLNLLGAQLMGSILGQQAAMVAFVDCFVFIGWTFILMIPLLLIVKAPRRHDKVNALEAIAE